MVPLNRLGGSTIFLLVWNIEIESEENRSDICEEIDEVLWQDLLVAPELDTKTYVIECNALGK